MSIYVRLNILYTHTCIHTIRNSRISTTPSRIPLFGVCLSQLPTDIPNADLLIALTWLPVRQQFRPWTCFQILAGTALILFNSIVKHSSLTSRGPIDRTYQFGSFELHRRDCYTDRSDPVSVAQATEGFNIVRNITSRAAQFCVQRSPIVLPAEGEVHCFRTNKAGSQSVGCPKRTTWPSVTVSEDGAAEKENH